MRVNIYAEEMTDRIEIVEKTIDGQVFTGLRIYLYLPVTVGKDTVRGPFLHREGDDDSAAVTFWGKRDLTTLCTAMIEALRQHYTSRERQKAS